MKELIRRQPVQAEAHLVLVVQVEAAVALRAEAVVDVLRVVALRADVDKR